MQAAAHDACGAQVISLHIKHVCKSANGCGQSITQCEERGAYRRSRAICFKVSSITRFIDNTIAQYHG